MTDAERSRVYRDRKRGKPARTPSPCGTYAAARRHIRKGEPLDDQCRQALSAYQAEQHLKRKTSG